MHISSIALNRLNIPISDKIDKKITQDVEIICCKKAAFGI